MWRYGTIKHTDRLCLKADTNTN